MPERGRSLTISHGANKRSHSVMGRGHERPGLTAEPNLKRLVVGVPGHYGPSEVSNLGGVHPPALGPLLVEPCDMELDTSDGGDGFCTGEQINEEGRTFRPPSSSTSAPVFHPALKAPLLDKDGQPRWKPVVEEVLAHAKFLLGIELVSTDVNKLVGEAFDIGDSVYNQDRAVAWGEENFPDGRVPLGEVAVEDEKLFKSVNGNLREMVKVRQDELSADRLSEERAMRLRDENPDKERILDLAKGLRVPHPIHFKPQPVPPKKTTLYQRVHLAVDGQFYKMVQSGLVLVLTLASALTIPGIHFSGVHWAVNHGKDAGRPIFNGSSGLTPTTQLNGDETAEMAAALWGDITLPTISGIIEMINTFRDECPERPWSDLVLWKMDLKGAFTLLFVRPENVRFFAIELMCGLVLLFMCGIFGWTAMPAAFAVVSRALEYELNASNIRSKIYVDDTIAISWLDKVDEDMSCAEAHMCDLLGSKAVADDKTVRTSEEKPRIDVIGWNLDIKNQRLTITRRLFLKAIYLFFKAELNGLIPVKLLMQLASLGSRYELVCGFLRPFNQALYASYMGQDETYSIKIKDSAKWSIRMWRTILVCTYFKEDTFARTFDSFRIQPACHVIQFDASLTGIGVWIQIRNRPGDPDMVSMGAGHVEIPWEIGVDSSYQNTAEFVAGLLGLIILIRDCVRFKQPLPKAVAFRGDSVSALTWLDKEKCKGTRAFCACTLLNLIVAKWNIQIADTSHVLAEFNETCDKLSRNRTVAEMLPTSRDLYMHTDIYITTALELCDPTRVDHNIRHFEKFWKRANDFVSSLCNPWGFYGPPSPRLKIL